MGGLFGRSVAKKEGTSGSGGELTPDQVREQQQQQQQAEMDELSRILAGAPDNKARVADTQRFIGSNQRHTYADCAWGVAAYTFSGLQHVHGQSTALTLLSMWAAGTTFFVNAAMRKVLTEASLASLEDEGGSHGGGHDAAATTGGKTKKMGKGGEGGEADPVAGLLAGRGTVGHGAAVAKWENAVDNGGASARDERRETARHQLRTIASAADFDRQQRNVFQLEAVGAWIWMLASLQQFRAHKRLKWCGYSSWMGLGCAVYYTFRHMYNVLVV